MKTSRKLVYGGRYQFMYFMSQKFSNLFFFFFLFPVVMLVTVEKDPWKAENKKNGDFLVSENFTFLPTY